MQVFSAFFKVLKRRWFEMSIYIITALIIAVSMTSAAGSGKAITEFSTTKLKIAVINYDKNGILAQELYNFLDANSMVKQLSTGDEITDALFFRDIEYALIIPEEFTDSILNGKEPKLEFKSAPDSAASVLLSNLVNKYVDTAIIYSEFLEIDAEKIAEYTSKDLAKEAKVNLKSSSVIKNQDNFGAHTYYFNYISYSAFSVLILGVCTGILVFNKTEIKRRNYCSPVRIESFNIWMIIAFLCFALVVAVVLLIPSFILYPEFMFTTGGVLQILALLVFITAALAVSLFLTNIVKTRSAMSAAANVVSLGLSFISGVFVPQQLLGESVLNIAKFSPVYWYIKSNQDLAVMNSYDFSTLKPFFESLGIILIFALVFFVIHMVISRLTRKSA
ncbi:MAG: ABC transporter permease [Eubacteriales bacterium]|nr:ABC transporter permease [Eubacteriales bacterium]MDD4475048.1 ABC transporter permease [Eubacteriales bacterium]